MKRSTRHLLVVSLNHLKPSKVSSLGSVKGHRRWAYLISRKAKWAVGTLGSSCPPRVCDGYARVSHGSDITQLGEKTSLEPFYVLPKSSLVNIRRPH